MTEIKNQVSNPVVGRWTFRSIIGLVSIFVLGYVVWRVGFHGVMKPVLIGAVTAFIYSAAMLKTKEVYTIFIPLMVGLFFFKGSDGAVFNEQQVAYFSTVFILNWLLLWAMEKIFRKTTVPVLSGGFTE